MSAFRLRFALLFVLAAACSDEGPHLVIDLTTGGETDALARSPVPARVEIDAESIEGVVKPLARTGNATSFDLGAIDRGTVLTLRYRAKDEAGKTLLFGESLPLQLDVRGDEASVLLFVQRTGELARLPGRVEIADANALVDRLGDRYVVLASGAKAELFDVGLFAAQTFGLPRAPRTIVASSQGLVTLDDEHAELVNIAGAAKALAVPAGLSLADVAGGAVVRGDQGVAYVVGATRDRASDAILRVADDGTLSVLRLTAPRAGAAATFVAGRGVVVVGGSASASGVEVVAEGGSSALPFPPDPTTLVAAVALDERNVITLGQGAPARRFDLACPANCSPVAWGTDLPAIGGTPSLGRVSDSAVFAISNSADGTSAAVLLSAASPPAAVTIRSPRSNARVMRGVGPTLLVVGGAPQIEAFVHADP